MTCNNKTYDVAFTHDQYGAHGRFHHATWAVDSKDEVLRAADICLENGLYIETGPHRHAVQQTFFLCVFEPGANRVESTAREGCNIATHCAPGLSSRAVSEFCILN